MDNGRFLPPDPPSVTGPPSDLVPGWLSPFVCTVFSALHLKGCKLASFKGCCPDALGCHPWRTIPGMSRIIFVGFADEHTEAHRDPASRFWLKEELELEPMFALVPVFSSLFLP